MTEEHPIGEQQAPPRELDLLLSVGIHVLTRLVPDWKPPLLAHPHAEPYLSAVDLMGDIVPGDQIMVMAPSGYYHHGIYVGKQSVAGTFRPAVVDFWAGFAKAKYPSGKALQHDQSARFALAWVEEDKLNPSNYNLALKNCEIFAAICRCGRFAITCHNDLSKEIGHLSAAPRHAIPRMGFK
eukprot:gene3631-13715_t